MAPRSVVLQPSASPLRGVRWLFLFFMVLGQAMISLSGGTPENPRIFAGVALALLGGLFLFVWRKGEMESYWKASFSLPPFQSLCTGILVLGTLLATSLMNYWTLQIGYDADETLEFATLGLPAWKQGWLWWGAYNETLAQNINALLCHLFSIRFETIKLTAFFFRTGAGLFCWLLASELFGKRVGLWCGLILATSVMFMCSFDSVIKEISGPMVFIACLYFTFRGLRVASAWNLFMGGIFAGLAPYTYVTRIAMGATLLGWVVMGMFSKESIYSFQKARWNLLWWLCGFLLLAGPFLYYFALYPRAQLLAGHVASQSSWKYGGMVLVIRTFWGNAMAIAFRGDSWFTRNFDAHPMLWWPWAIGFWVGLPLMFFRLRETRMAVPLLLMVFCLGLSSLSDLYVPNFKLSRTAMILSSIPAAIGIDFLAMGIARQFHRPWWAWFPFLPALFSLAHGGMILNTVMTDPESWLFRDAVKPREDFVHSNPHCRFWGVGSYITDLTPESAVTEMDSLRTVLETPCDGREVVFLFPDGSEKWQQNLVKTWVKIYPGGKLEIHSTSIQPKTFRMWPNSPLIDYRERNWTTFMAYRIPSGHYWSLPPVPEKGSALDKVSTWWRRVELLQKHGLPLEAWRDALRACHLDPGYYSKADQLLGNSHGREGRLEILLKGGLWEEAREDLEWWGKKSILSPTESKALNFLKTHGLEMKVYSTDTDSVPCIADFRQYFPEVCAGFNEAVARKRLHFAARAEGQIFAPREGSYSFEPLGLPGNPCAIKVDGKVIFEFSAFHQDFLESPPVYLKQGLHSFEAENCTFLWAKGESPVPACIPDPLSHFHGFEPCWSLKWRYEKEDLVLIPPEDLLSLDARENSALPWKP